MQVHHDEEVANRTGPESCAVAREGISEALTGECIGQPLSRERPLFSGADVVLLTEGNTDGCDIASTQTVRRGRRHWHVQTLLAREPGDLLLGRWRQAASGPHREGEEPKPMMHGWEKSDRCVVPAKLPNKAEQSAAEEVEGRHLLKRSAGRQRTCRTQRRITCVPDAAPAAWQNCMGCSTPNSAMLPLKRGARCGNAARRDLRGGRAAMRVPTAT